MAKKNNDMHDERLNRLAKYEGLLARWGESAGFVPDILAKDKAEWLMDKFTKYVDSEIRRIRGA